MLIKENFQCTQEEFDIIRASDNVPIKCIYCKNMFYRTKKLIVSDQKRRNSYPQFCSLKCHGLFNTTLNTQKVQCLNCNIVFSKKNSAIAKSPKHFCSQSCAALFNNKNKTHGTRRSKLEIWMELKLKELYPNLEILFNSKQIIGSELDIYIPSLKLAFELNGVFHYEPIYGKDKLNQIQNNDSNKFQKCQEKEISLCIIDTSSQKYFTELSSQKYLDIICKIISGSPGWNRTSVN